MKKPITIIVGAGPAGAEGLRGALGLTLRGDPITVIIDPAAEVAGREAARARKTLASFGHVVAGPEALAHALDADAIEVWGTWTAGPAPAAPRRRALLHLVRPGHAAAGVAPGDRVVHLDDALDDDQLLDHVLAAGTVAVW